VKYRHTQISFSKESVRSAILRERRSNDSICGENCVTVSRIIRVSWDWTFRPHQGQTNIVTIGILSE
jgi:hypothetical protein